MEINQVCHDCGVKAHRATFLKKHGSISPKDFSGMTGYEIGLCDFCKDYTGVNDTSKFFNPDFSLIQTPLVIRVISKIFDVVPDLIFISFYFYLISSIILRSPYHFKMMIIMLLIFLTTVMINKTKKDFIRKLS